MKKPSPPPDNCVRCSYWHPWPNGSVGKCHNIFSDQWSKWTKPAAACPQMSTTIDATLDDREDAAWLVKR